MAEYTEKFTSKLDWAMPFQRTGDFPLDRTSMFSSYADALAYAKRDGTDSRQLGGTSYVGQPITVYGKGVDGITDEVSLYIITAVGSSASLQKLAQSSPAGDYAADIAALQARCSELEADIVEINGKLVVATTGTDGLMAAADKLKLDGIESSAQVNKIEVIKLNGSTLEIAEKSVNIDLANYATKQDLAAIPKFAIKVVDALPETGDAATIYLVRQTETAGQDAFDEYLWVAGGTEDPTTGRFELIGNTDIDLSSYVTTDAMNQAIADAVVDMATNASVNNKLAEYAKTADVTSQLANKADSSTVVALADRVTAAEGDIDAIQAAGYQNESQVIALIAATNIQGSKVEGKVASAAMADKVANALTVGAKTFDGSSPVTIEASDIGALTEIVKATDTALGGIKTGYVEADRNFAVKLDENDKAYVTVPAPVIPEYTQGDGIIVSGNVISIAAGGVTETMLADGAVTTDKIGTASVTNDKIVSVSTDKLTQGSEELILDGGVAL